MIPLIREAHVLYTVISLVGQPLYISFNVGVYGSSKAWLKQKFSKECTWL